MIRGPLQVSVDHEGRTRIKERYVVSAPLSGRLPRVELDPGDPIKANETVLAAIEPADPALLDPRARAEAEARVKAAEAPKRRATPNLERATPRINWRRATSSARNSWRGPGHVASGA